MAEWLLSFFSSAHTSMQLALLIPITSLSRKHTSYHLQDHLSIICLIRHVWDLMDAKLDVFGLKDRQSLIPKAQHKQ